MITEYELLKQGEEEYMSDAQKDFFRARLLDVKKQTEERLQTARTTISQPNISSDPLDEATEEEIRDITLIRIKRDTQVYHDIELALDRLRHDDFGYCEETGVPLGIPRLLANPLARYSTTALMKKEEQGRLEGYGEVDAA